MQKAHANDINRLKFSSTSSLISTAGSDGKVKLWDFNSSKLRATFQSGGRTGAAIGLDMSTKSISASFSDKSVQVWDVNTGATQVGISLNGIQM